MSFFQCRSIQQQDRITGIPLEYLSRLDPARPTELRGFRPRRIQFASWYVFPFENELNLKLDLVSGKKEQQLSQGLVCAPDPGQEVAVSFERHRSDDDTGARLTVPEFISRDRG